MNKQAVTVGIPAYQAEANIKQLLKSLVEQREVSYNLERIVVYCDGCTDATVTRAKMVKDARIEVIDGAINRGFSYGVSHILKENKSDIVVILNDDIQIPSHTMLEQLLKAFSTKKDVGLVGGRIIPFAAKTFIARAIYASTLAYDLTALEHRDGNSRLTFDGKVMALRRDFATKLPPLSGNAGNVDIFIYMACRQLGYAYQFAKDAVVEYRLPETIQDFRNQELRNRRSRVLMRIQFPDLIKKEIDMPKLIYLKNIIKVILHYPLESLFFKLVINSIFRMPKEINFVHWDLATSTKRLK